jgi:hypothetical protein
MSVKRLHRDIMLTAAYRRASGRHAANEQIDGANRFYWRHDRRRLGAEGIRDAILAASGDLDPKVGGPSLDLDGEENNRRTIYGRVSRFQVDKYLQTFDFPNPSLSAERRYTTNVPGQSLYFMNSPFVRRQAELLVNRLVEEAEPPETAADDAHETGSPNGSPNGTADGGGHPDPGSSPVFHDREMIEAAYPLLYGREATEPEIAAGLAFLEERRADFLAEALEKLETETDEAEADGAEAGDGAEAAEEPDDEADDDASAAEHRASMRAWIQYARALFSTAEFRFVG